MTDAKRREMFVDEFNQGLPGEHIEYDAYGSPYKTLVLYIGGSPLVDGTWRIAISGANLVIEKREAGVWNTKETITP